MPLYKSNPTYLEKSIRSLLNQTYENFEILMILDKSHPHEDEKILWVIDKFSDDKRIKLIINKNKLGITRSLNKGILLSKGEIIARADDDDLYDPLRFEKQIRILSDGMYLVGSWVYLIDHKDRIIGMIKKPVSFTEIKIKALIHTPFAHQSVILKKELFKKAGIYNFAFEGAEDYELWLRVLSKNLKAYNIPEYLTRVRINPNSLTRNRMKFKSRSRYIKCKLFGVLKYGWRGPLEILSTFLSFNVFLIFPTSYLVIMKKLNRFL